MSLQVGLLSEILELYYYFRSDEIDPLYSKNDCDRRYCGLSLLMNTVNIVDIFFAYNKHGLFKLIK